MKAFFVLALLTASSLFTGYSESTVDRTVGAAEGTRTVSGEFTEARFGHIDPANGVTNVGTFSCQHCTGTADQADVAQRAILSGYWDVMAEQALFNGMELSLEEAMNGIDLANQAPQAALGWSDSKSVGYGYVYWLKEARKMYPAGNGTASGQGIVWARIQSFHGEVSPNIDIGHDQLRRASQIWYVLRDMGYTDAQISNPIG
jgi:hypothetical protein